MSARIEDRASGLRLILLDRPGKRNAIDGGLVNTIRQAVETATGNAIVLGSTNPTAFSSGADLGLEDADRAAVSAALYELYALMREAPQVIIAAANGHAVGGGAQLLLASDLRFADPGVTIRFVGAGYGLVVGAWGLPSLVGRGRALDLCVSMRPVSAEEALVIGLVDRLVDDPLAAAIEYGDQLEDLPPSSVAHAKQIVGISDLDAALRAEQKRNAGWDGSMTPGTG